MDKRRLKGGQNWDVEITRALQRAAIIVVFLSEHSVDRRGYAQREIKTALDQARDKLIDDIYLIPVMLDDGVGIPPQLAQIQVIRSEDGDLKSNLRESIDLQLAKLGLEVARIQGESRVRWSSSVYRDSWEGLPGYDTEYHLLRFTSDDYPQVSEVTDVIKGWLASAAMAQRDAKFGQSPDVCAFGQDRSRRQNSWEAACGGPKVKERVLSVPYSIWWYGAGAAHPNQGFHTFNFTLDPVTQISDLESVFSDPDQAFEILQSEVRSQLKAMKFEGMTADDTVLTLVPEDVDAGTACWDDFGSFIFGEDGIEILFSPYNVAPYAFGAQFASVEYQKIAKFIHPHYAYSLGVDHMQHDHVPWLSEQYQTFAEEQPSEP
jgi:hypothetical protein